jgi:hypothetical protein
MAIIKQLDLDNGASGNYWKIIKTDINFLSKVATITFGLLKDKSFNELKYDSEVNREKLLLSTKSVSFRGDSFPFTDEALEGENIKAVAYTAVRATDKYFQDAIDDK